VSGLDQFKKTYFEECAELLDAAATHLAQIADGNYSTETLHAVFRAVHSIKGGAGAFGFTRLVNFSHELETVLDRLREGLLSPTPELVAILQRGTDVLADIVTAAQTETEVEDHFGEDVILALDELMNGQTQSKQPSAQQRVMAPVPSPALSSAPVPAENGTGDGAGYRIVFVPRTDMLQKANEPLLLVRQMKRLGKLTVEADLSRLPDLFVMQPEEAYLSWTFLLETAAPQSAVEEIFEFVVDDCDLIIEPLGATNTIEPLGATNTIEPLGAAKTIEPLGSGAAAKGGMVPMTASRPLESAIPSEVVIFGKMIDPPTRSEISAAPPAAMPVSAAPPAAMMTDEKKPVAVSHSIRVDLEKVDRLVNLVGELVITQAMVVQHVTHLPVEQFPALIQGVEALSQHARELQESVMAIRAQPVKSVFQRLPRLVREVASELGKEVRLVTSGENTEIDKTVIEQLGDPLTHLIRNALDHGLEDPAEREARGKPRQGTISVSAEQRSGRIVIEVMDDGRGINREAVLAKAQEKGFIPPGAQLTDDEIHNLIFLPGFSTAETVSNISGRGVGMDVVKRNLQALGGRISIDSRKGAGSRFVLSFPLTLAVLDGMVVGVGAETYVLPLAHIIESLRPQPRNVHRVVESGDVLAIRGEYVPLAYLHRIFEVPGAIADPSKGIVVLVETDGSSRIGLVVDELLGQQQVVVKSLEANYDAVPGVAGATILGSGRVALILDVIGLRNLAGAVQQMGQQMGQGRPALRAELH